MRSSIRKAVCWGLGSFLVLRAASAVAAPITFDFVFQSMGGARAEGFITFEETLLPNPKDCDEDSFAVPSAVVLALQVTVSGASSGNGTFHTNQFEEVAWCTNGAVLNLAAQLVGQATPGDPWGTPSDGAGGDFNLFGFGSAPNGENYFTLCADDGEADCMELRSMIQGPVRLDPAALVTAPAVGRAGLAAMIILLLAIGIAGLRRRRAD